LTFRPLLEAFIRRSWYSVNGFSL